MKWPWRRRDDSDAKQRRDEAERQLRAAKKMTARVERLAADMALDPDEFVDRVSRAFQPRSSP